MGKTKALIVLGKENGLESYHLIIGSKYFSATPSLKDKEYKKFIDTVSDTFAKMICDEKNPVELGILNGFKVDDGNLVRTSEINDNNSFQKEVESKLTKLCGGRLLLSNRFS